MKPVIQALVAPLLFVAASAQASLVITDLAADADSYIQQHTPTTNFGNASIAVMKGQSSFNRKSYLRVDLSSLPDLGTDPITAATLTLNFVESGIGSSIGTGDFTFEVFGLDNDSQDNWVETSINWNNAPANDTVAPALGFLPADTTSLGTFDVTGKGIGAQTFSSTGLTNFLEANRTGNQTATLLIRRVTLGTASVNYAHAFATRNTANAESLQITQLHDDGPGPVPSPGVLSLLMAGLLGLGWKYRKHGKSSAHSSSGKACCQA